MKTNQQIKVKLSGVALCFGLLVLLFVSFGNHQSSDKLESYVASATAKTTTTTKVMSSEYNQTIANHSLMYSLLSYCDEALVESWSCPYCGAVKNFKLYKYVKTGINGDTLVAIVGYDSTYQQIVVVFRGSSNTANWIANLEFWQTDYPGVPNGRVHSGFYRSWKELEPSVTAAYKEVLTDYPNAQVLFTGHSLGAALAALAYLDLKDIYSDDSSMYPVAFYLHSFGKPRWGNSVMAEYFDQNIDFHWRVVFLHDIVPQVPPPFLGYQHSGREIWYWCNSPLSYYLCSSSTSEDKTCEYAGGTVHDHMHYLNTDFLCGSAKGPELPEPPTLPITCVPDPNTKK